MHRNIARAYGCLQRKHDRVRAACIKILSQNDKGLERELLRADLDKVRELFEHEPGVLVIGDRNPRHKRRYLTLRIPQTVLQRVHNRLAAKPTHL